MNPQIMSLIFWTPRVLTNLLAIFLTIFSLDIFEMEKGFWNITLALFLHNLPSIGIILILVLAWRKEWIGAVIFPLFGLIYLFINLGKMHSSTFAVITSPLVLLGFLFLLVWYKGRWE